jgi:hypothetical protein
MRAQLTRRALSKILSLGPVSTNHSDHEEEMMLPCPIRMRFPNLVADGVVLQGEESMQQLHTSPPIV